MDRKNQTRRIIKSQTLQSTPSKFDFVGTEKVKLFGKKNEAIENLFYEFHLSSDVNLASPLHVQCPYGEPGDILWVRETWGHTKQINLHPTDENYGVVYKGDMQPWEDYEYWKWKPAIHMPKEVCRLFLRIKSVRPELLQDISIEDCVNEGIEGVLRPGYVKGYLNYTSTEKIFNDFFSIDDEKAAYKSFKSLWDRINGTLSWNMNPWVWRIEFEKIDSSLIKIVDGDFIFQK